MPTIKPTCAIVIDEDLLKRIEDFQFNNRFRNRSAAIVYIIQAGMDALAAEYPELDRKVQLETGETQKNVGLADEKRLHLRTQG